jgi:hypothetical protein
MELTVKDSFSGTGNYSYVSTQKLKQIELSNDDTTNDLTAVIDGKTFTLQPYETLIEDFVSFVSVDITTDGDWRAIVRG